MATSLLGRKPLLGQLPNESHWARQGLVRHWVMNEGSGNKIFDVSGNGKHGTLSTQKWRDGGLLFEEADNSFADCGLLDLGGLTNFTIFVVFKWRESASGAENCIVGNSDGGSTARIKMRLEPATQTWEFFYKSGGINMTDLSVSYGVKHSSTLVMDNSTMRGYADGIASNQTDAITIDSDNSINPLAIGTDISFVSDDLFGIVYQVRVYNRALSPSEIAELHWNEYPEYEDRLLFAPPPVVGRTTKNTDAYPLGVNVGMSWRMPSNFL